MADSRPPIPLPMKREIRQRCAFGCVICGAPLYEYHHLKPYSEELKHEAENLTLLCDSHHKQATNGLLTVDQIATADLNPFNIQRGVSSPFGLNFEGADFECLIGTNKFTNSLLIENNDTFLIPISIDDIDLIFVLIEPDGKLYLFANIFDECNLPLLKIQANEIVYSTGSWDVEFIGKTLTVREGARKIFFEIELSPPNKIKIQRARLLCNGIEIRVRKRYLYVSNTDNIFTSNCVNGPCIGLQLGRNERMLPIGMTVPPNCISRYHLKSVSKKERAAFLRSQK